MTNEQLTQLVVAELGLQDIDALNETDLVALWLYNGTLDVLSRTRCTVRCVQFQAFANQDTYTIDHNIMALVDVDMGRRYRRNRADRAFNDASFGPVPVYYPGNVNWFFPTAFVLIRSDVLLIEPMPSEDCHVQVWAVLKPEQMSADDDSPEMEKFGAIPFEYHDVLVTYACWKAASYMDDGSSQNGERYRILYEGADGRGGRLGQIKQLVNKRGTARAPRRHVRLKPTSYYPDFYVG